jgi:hypothetical protein
MERLFFLAVSIIENFMTVIDFNWIKQTLVQRLRHRLKQKGVLITDTGDLLDKKQRQLVLKRCSGAARHIRHSLGDRVCDDGAALDYILPFIANISLLL